ncbi:phosphatidylserine decarboxylase proenzyme, mitochondrial isoform X2 [Daktulosphaira vitifoliae]|uniref:phosphatidylserine decarboxylase proenzyme, mitochondrial isoform X2 n=1 Tax=Daktulosphaira vitifoliae TaxID=58002 RepID=UPI0021AA2377|nr:phosphatidylserine decarboxylase proenzyme, mitochondrial isoform X2 [Daktulosphaira vitifoliae]
MDEPWIPYCCGLADILFTQYFLYACTTASNTPPDGIGVKETATKNSRWWSWSNLIYPIPTGVGLTLLAVLQWRRLNKQQQDGDQQPIYTQNLRLCFYKAIPLRAMSRLWGYITDFYIPQPLRYWMFTAYSKLFGVNIDEIELPMEAYKSLGEFFARRLKEDARPICFNRPVVSPADGTIVTAGRVTSCQVEQVKGVTYTIKSFLGSPTWLEEFSSSKTNSSPNIISNSNVNTNLMKRDTSSKYNGGGWSINSTFLFYHYGLLTMHMYCINFIFNFLYQGVSFFSLSFKKQDVMLSDTTTEKTISVQRKADIDNDDNNDCKPFDPHWNEYKSKLLHNPNNELYQMVIYLAPGDYHRFHSPVEWTVKFRRHFQGELLSVNPKVAQFLPDLFVLNERAVYVGEWKHGFFSMTAVGATNVGSIRVYSDKGLQTNMRCRRKDFNQNDCSLETKWTKGQEVGEFRMGSTVVLLFEAPKEFLFDVDVGQTIKMGQAVGKISLVENDQNSE